MQSFSFLQVILPLPHVLDFQNLHTFESPMLLHVPILECASSLTNTMPPNPDYETLEPKRRIFIGG